MSATSSKLGVHTQFDGADWPAIRDRVFGRIDPIAAGGEEYRRGLDNVTVIAIALIADFLLMPALILWLKPFGPETETSPVADPLTPRA